MGALLTDVAAVRQFMQEDDDDGIEEQAIETLIAEVSDALPRYCEREFGPTDKQTRSFEYRPTEGGVGLYLTAATPELIDLCPYEYRVLHKVTLDPEIENGTIVEASKYRPGPRQTRDGTYMGIRLGIGLPPRPRESRQFPTRRIDIEADWGTAQVPPVIKEYANQTVESWLHLRRDNGVSLNTPEQGEPPMRADDIPPAVRWGLDKTWRRTWLPR